MKIKAYRTPDKEELEEFANYLRNECDLAKEASEMRDVPELITEHHKGRYYTYSVVLDYFLQLISNEVSEDED